MKVYEALGDETSRALFDIRLKYAITRDKEALRDAVYSLNRYEFTDLFEYIARFPEDTEIIIFGAGSTGHEAYRLRTDSGYGKHLAAYGDNDIEKQGTTIDGLPVYSASELCEHHGDAIVIIASSQYGLDIYSLLLRTGVHRDRLYYPRYRRLMGMTGTQYFDLPYLMKVPEEVYIDGGAFDIGTCTDFIDWYGADYKQIVAFEPSRYSVNACRQRIRDYHIERIELIPKGLYSEDTTLRFTHKAAGSSVSNDGSDAIEVTSIDHALNGERATFIKLDVEGCELEALKGAQKTIRTYRPKLAVCIYHKPEDIYELPLYILSLVPEYKLYIRHYSNVESETILYALVD